MENSLITEEMKAAIGVESEPSVYEIEKEAIRRWAEAVGDPNPIYHDEVYAKQRGYRSLVAPPFFLPHYGYPLVHGNSRVKLKIPFERSVAGGNDIEIKKVLQAGDRLFVTTAFTEFAEKEGRLGKMLLVTSATFIRDKKGELLSKARHVEIYY